MQIAWSKDQWECFTWKLCANGIQGIPIKLGTSISVIVYWLLWQRVPTFGGKNELWVNNKFLFNEAFCLLGCYIRWIETDVSGLCIGPIFNGQLTLEDGTDRWPRKGGVKPRYAVWQPRRQKAHFQRGASIRTRRSVFNQELRELHKRLDTVVDIEMKRLEWIGHILRIDYGRVDKKIHESKLEGRRRRRRGRPLLRCLENTKDLWEMKVKNGDTNNGHRRLGACN